MAFIHRKTPNARGSASMRLVLAGAMALALVACSPVYRNHGYIPAEDELAAVQVGTDTKDTVAVKVGRPSAEGVLNGDAWYFVQSRFQTRGAGAAREIDRQVVAITFDESDRVANVERFGLEKGEVVTISRRVTDTNTRGIGLIRSILGSLGRVRADQLVD